MLTHAHTQICTVRGNSEFMGPPDSLGDSAVNVAVEHIQILEYLLQLGAKMNVRRKSDGRSALLAAAWMGKPNPNPNPNLNLNLTLTQTLTLTLSITITFR
jgi:hypothetical protein